MHSRWNSCAKPRQVLNEASLPFRPMLFYNWLQGLTAQPTTASSSLSRMRKGFI